ncbi:MAG: DUF1573 domain-containing protein [Planctomycetota bacterium]
MRPGKSSFVASLSLAALMIMAAPMASALAQQVYPAEKGKAKPVPIQNIQQIKQGGKAKPATLKEVDPNADQPIFSIDTMTHDFGTIWVGPKLDHTFKVTNKGTKPLEITKVRPSCGCTIAGNYPRKLEPGQSGDFPFSINSNKVRGRFSKSITVSCNDPVNSDIRLTLSGNCKRYVEVIPAAANFGRVYGGDPQERVLKVTNNTEEPIELELDVPKDSKFKFDLVTVEQGKKFEIRVKMAETSTKPGQARTTAVLKTNVEAQKEIKVAATATIPKRLDVVPSTITLAATPSKGSKGITRIVRVTNYGPNPVKVLEANCSNPKINSNLSEKIVGKNYDIRLEFPAGYKPPANGDKLVIKTDDKEFAQITVDIASRASKKTPPRRKRPAEELVGKPAPEFMVKTVAGKDLGPSIGEIQVLDFFAVNCGFCKKQIPRMEKVRQDYEGKPVRFVAAAETMRNKKYSDQEIMDKLKELGYKGEVLLDTDNKVGPKFKATSFPTMVIVGKTGKVEAVNVGNIGDLETRMKGQLDALIAGKPVPTYETKAPAKRSRPAEEMKGKAAPAFTLTTIDGKPIGNAEVSAAPATVLNFIAPNCGFCKRQLPNVEKIRKKYADKGVRFVNVSETMRKKYPDEEAVDIFRGTGNRAEIAIDNDNVVGKAFKATSYPTMMVIGKDGKVAHVNIGAKADIDTLLSGQLDALIKKAGS